MKISGYLAIIVYMHTVTGQDGCHCLNGNGCPDHACYSGCNTGWSGPSCHRGNIALGRFAFQTSTRYKSSCNGVPCSPLGANLAVDGDIRTHDEYFCSQTGLNKVSANLTVVLETPKLIDQIGLYFVDDYVGEMMDLKIMVGNGRRETLCYQQPNTAPFTSHVEIVCEQQLVGISVTVVLPPVNNTHRVLRLCEIEIYECADLWWGGQCANKCNNCPGDTAYCDMRTGQCSTRDVNIVGGAVSFMPNPLDQYGTAAQVVDGVTTDSNCATIKAQSPWWNIKFQQSRTVSRIKIFWSSSDIPSSITVTVGNNIDCFSGEVPATVREFSLLCAIPVTGHRVTIFLPGLEQLRLCEAQIYECRDGFYGFNCATRCNCEQNQLCNKENGVCFYRGSSSTPATTTSMTSEMVTTSPTTANMSSTSSNIMETSVSTAESISSGIKASNYQPDNPDMTTIIAASIGAGVGLLLVVIIIVVVIRWKRRRNEMSPTKSQNIRAQRNPGVAETTLSNENIEEKASKRRKRKAPDPSKAVEDNHVNQQVEEPVQDVRNVESNELPDDPEDEPKVTPDNSDPYYNHIPRAITVTGLRDYVQDRFDGVGFENEYLFLPAGLRASHETGKTVDNNPKNRFKNIYAYDHSRVVLERGEEEEEEVMEEETDYINASYIERYKSPKKFIATQGPVPETVADFWLMVWQQETREIIMLTNIYERKRKKCEKYWPSEGEAGNYGIINVCLEKTKQYADYTVRVLTLHHLGNNIRREVIQYHFTTWPDHDVPSTASLVSFWRLVRRQITSHEVDSKRGPIVVHCSAGVGRTGTYIGLDYLVEEAEGEGKVNIFTAVLGMRDDRVNMVQTKGQYSFLHLVLLEALHCKNTWTPAGQITAKLTHGKAVEEEYQDSNIISTLRIPEEKKKSRIKGSAKQQEDETQDDHLGDIKVTSWPSFFMKKGFLHVGAINDDYSEEFWNFVHKGNVATIVTINQETPTAMPTIAGASTIVGKLKLTLSSKTDVSEGIKELKLKINPDSKDRGTSRGNNGGNDVVIYSLTLMSEEPGLDKTRLQTAVQFIINRQHASRPHPVILQCRNSPSKCALFAAAANVISCLRLDHEVDIYLTVREIQCHKGQPVTCLDDYRLLYELASDYVQSNITYANMGENVHSKVEC